MFTRDSQFSIRCFLILCVLVVAMAGSAAGTSLYLIANHHTRAFDAWNIGPPGSIPPITYQATYSLTHANDPGDIAVWVEPGTDPPEATLFITSEFDYGVELVDAKTMTSLGWVGGAYGLAGITMDNANNILYTIDRDTDHLYAYSWDPVGKTLTAIPGMDPFNLPNCSGGFGVSLDDINGILYVADTRGQRVRGYDVNTWTEVKTIVLSHMPMGIVVDRQRGFLYTASMNQKVEYCATNPWGSSFGSTLLSKYDLATDVETTVDMGVGGTGLAVDEVTGLVYLTEGCEGNRLAVWDTETTPFTLVHVTSSLGSPAAVAIANANVSYNPLNLAKNDVVVGYGVYVGQNFTYEITCDNYDNAYDVTGVTMVDNLPIELDFVSETKGGVPGTGVYDAPTHTVAWDIGTIPASQAGPLIQLVVTVNQNATPNTTIYNYCTIESDQTPPTTVIGDDPDNPNPEAPPGTPVVPVPDGCVAGYVTADCPATGTGLLGVVIDVYDGSGDIVASAVTDVDGYYEMCEIIAGDYSLTIVTPLGYQVSPDEVAITIVGGETENVDFAFTCVEITASPRTIGFWKHQVGVATGGKGHAHIDAPTLCDYLNLIENHFNGNAVNQVIIYQPPIASSCEDKLLVSKSLLNLEGSVDMIDRARQQLMALLLNVASGKLSQIEIISVDGATVSQAITYCDNVIDDPASDYEMAKTICDEINNNREVPAGMIPLSTANIAYKEGGIPVTYALSQNYPNPFNPTTQISLSLPEAADVRLEIYNITGQKVTTLVAGRLEAGQHTIEWNASDVASGIYLYRLTTPEYVETKKMLLLK